MFDLAYDVELSPVDNASDHDEPGATKKVSSSCIYKLTSDSPSLQMANMVLLAWLTQSLQDYLKTLYNLDAPSAKSPGPN